MIVSTIDINGKIKCTHVPPIRTILYICILYLIKHYVPMTKVRKQTKIETLNHTISI